MKLPIKKSKQQMKFRKFILMATLSSITIMQTSLLQAAPVYKYNSLNQLVESRLDDGTVVKNYYDGAGRLSKQEINGRVRYLIQDDSGGLSRLLGWEDANGDIVKIIHGPGGPVAEHNPENGSLTQYYLKDHLGSVRGMLDFRGDVEGRTFYDPYGKITGQSSEQPALGYTGEYTDESDLVYLRARHYSPQLGRFLQRDSFPGFENRTMSQNPYAYAEHNPMNYTDPSGNAISLGLLAIGTAAFYAADWIWSRHGMTPTTSDPYLERPEQTFPWTRQFTNWSGDVGKLLTKKFIPKAVQVCGKIQSKIGWVHPRSRRNSAPSPAFFNEQRRRIDCILAGGSCRIDLAGNPNADNFRPPIEIRRFSPVKEYHDMIESAASEFGVDADLVRAIMFMETTHGYYDALLPMVGLKNKSILPMNINHSYWGDVVGTREQLHDPAHNIRAGTQMLRLIQNTLPPDAGIEKTATLYNNLNATEVNDYGARVKSIYVNKEWVKWDK